MEIGQHRVSGGRGNLDVAAARVIGIDTANKDTGFGEAAYPAQRRGRRHCGGDAQAGNGHTLAFQPCRDEIKQHVPCRIGEDIGREEAFTIAPQLDQSTDECGIDPSGLRWRPRDFDEAGQLLGDATCFHR